MDKLFLTILNMSLTGAFVIAAICLARLPLKKAPKIITYCLWAVAGFRLVFPFSIESIFSLIPFKAQPIPPDIAMQPIPRIDSGIPFVNNAVSSVLPTATPTASVNPLQIWVTVGALVWLIGVAVMLIYGVASYVMLKRKMRNAAHVDTNIYEAENIKSPFVLGVFAPKIYLPVGLSARERSYILLHEQTHIKRHDHIVKFAAFFVLCLHWFNPLAWAAFLLMGVDMEMSCDERVLKEIGGETKKDYSLSLLSLATERRIIGGSPLAFGEGGIKERIKNVLNFRKRSRMIIIVAVAFVAVLSIGFAVNKIANAPLIEMKMVYEENPAFFSKDMKLIWDDTVYHVTPMNNTGRGKEVGYATDEYSTWRIYELKGYDRDYLLAVESEDEWRVMSSYSPETPFRQYILENATEKQKMERMLSVTLYNDGTARLAVAPISSYALLSPYYYTFTDGELLIHYENDNIIAKFTVADDNTLVFKSATVPLFADEGARYTSIPHDASLFATDTFGNPDGKIMTLDDVCRLDKLGDNLAVASLESFIHSSSADANGEFYRYPVEGGKWEVELDVNYIEGEDDIVSAWLISSGFEFKPQNMFQLGKGNAVEYIQYVEDFTPALLELTPQEESSALEAARNYYASLEFPKGKTFTITRIADFQEFAGWVMADRAKGKLAAFEVMIEGSGKPERSIVLTQTTGGLWEVINEGY